MKPNTSPACPPQFNHVYRVSYEANIHENYQIQCQNKLPKLSFSKKVLKSIKFFPEHH